MAASVSVSRADVASSKIKIDGFFKNILAMESRCFCPPDSFTPRSPITVFKPSGYPFTKSLTSLLPRFYEPSEGVISIDGIDIKDMTLSSLRGQIGVVQQDVFLFSGTLRENIAYGRLDASEEEIRQAVRQAHLEDLVNGYPDGLNTVIGERGVKLSGGQKQRLSIARMFLNSKTFWRWKAVASARLTASRRARRSPCLNRRDTRLPNPLNVPGGRPAGFLPQTHRAARKQCFPAMCRKTERHPAGRRRFVRAEMTASCP